MEHYIKVQMPTLMSIYICSSKGEEGDWEVGLACKCLRRNFANLFFRNANFVFCETVHTKFIDNLKNENFVHTVLSDQLVSGTVG